MLSIITGIFGNVALGWVGRRILEVGGWLAAIIPLFMSMPAEHQETIMAILSGQGGGLSLATWIGFVGYILSQIASFRSTVKDHTVVRGRKYPPVLTEDEARAMTGHQGPIPRR